MCAYIHFTLCLHRASKARKRISKSNSFFLVFACMICIRLHRKQERTAHLKRANTNIQREIITVIIIKKTKTA